MSFLQDTKTNKLIIESVVPLTDGQLANIKDMLKADKNTIIENERNASLIAGLRIRYKGKLIDMSIKHMLEQLEGSLA